MGSLPKTRPVVSGCQSMGVHLSNILSELIESLADEMEGSSEFLSCEDFLSRVDDHNKMVLEKLESGQADFTDLILLGTDAVSLFPSLDAAQCAKLIHEE